MKKIIPLLLTALTLACLFAADFCFAETADFSEYHSAVIETENGNTEETAAETAQSANTSAQSAAVMEINSGRILFEKNADARLPMASTTKIMTALVAIELAGDIDEPVRVDGKAVGVEGSSVYLRENEILTLRELLYGLMLRSGNDCAVAVAIHVGQTVENFVKLMNDKAAALGLKDTRFTNPHGLHDDGHYTSARDLGVIACEAMKNPVFREIVSTKKITVGENESTRLLLNKNKLLYNMENACGVKTGYTKRAGRCFVGAAGGETELVCVVLNCGPMFEDAKRLLSEFQSLYKTRLIVPKNKLCTVEWKKGEPVYYRCDGGFSYPCTDEEAANISKEISYDEKEGFYKITVTLGKQLIFSQKLYTI